MLSPLLMVVHSESLKYQLYECLPRYVPHVSQVSQKLFS